MLSISLHIVLAQREKIGLLQAQHFVNLKQDII